MPKVSIIIPFNNVEDYMEECLKSVVNQTLNDIEIILINDASKDNSRQIAQNYANNDSRIKIIDIDTQKGQGYARNRGIETAQGEYIGFVDSDDFIEPDMFELLYNSAKENNTDITMCQVREYDDLNNKYITSDYYSLASLGRFIGGIFSAEDTKTNILDINVALWNKIYKKDFLLSTGEMFPEGFIYEDLPFFFGTYLKAKRINIVWKNLYCYRINRKNSTMQQYNNKILDRPPMVSLTYEKIKTFPFLDTMLKDVQAWIINDLFHRYSLMKENLHQEFFFLMKKVFKNLNIEDINDDYWKKVYHFQGYLLVVNNTFKEFNQKVFTEYLDIREVENRLFYEINNSEQIDKRFNLIYEDITKNYKYTEDLIKNLDGKLSDQIYDNLTQTKKEIFELKQEFNYQLQNHSENQNKIVQDIINTQKIDIKNINKQIEDEKIIAKLTIEKLKEELTEQLNIQQQQYKEELENIKKQMFQIQTELREEMKSPLKKFIEKHQKKSEK